MPVAAVVLILAQATSPHPPIRPTPRESTNSTADIMVERSLVLGMDFAPPAPGKSRASNDDVQALAKASPRTWLDAQIKLADDSIAEPPKELRDFLEERREPIWAVVAALEKGPPEWKAMSLEEQIPRLLPWVHLHKVLLATALVQERDGNAIDAERALEASWSLGRAFENEKTLITRIL